MPGLSELSRLEASAPHSTSAPTPKAEAAPDEIARFNAALNAPNDSKAQHGAAAKGSAGSKEQMGSPDSTTNLTKERGALPSYTQGSSQGPDSNVGQPQGSAAELSSIFSALLSGQGSQLPSDAPPNAVTTHAESSAALSEAQQHLTSGIVDRILVSERSLSTGSEVKLVLGSAVAPLDGVEITLKRNLEGMLAVELNSQNHKQFQKLVELRPALVEALEEHETKAVTLVFTAETDQHGSEQRDS